MLGEIESFIYPFGPNMGDALMFLIYLFVQRGQNPFSEAGAVKQQTKFGVGHQRFSLSCLSIDKYITFRWSLKNKPKRTRGDEILKMSISLRLR